MTEWSDSEFEDGTAFAVLQEYGFFPYSGADGDLFRKHGLAGWRVSVYGRYLIRIQKKGRRVHGRNTWRTQREWRTDRDQELDAEAIDEFETALATLVETGELEND